MNRKLYPVSNPDIGELELRYVREAVESGWVSSIGQFLDRFESGFAKYCSVSHGVAMTNGTDALFIALKALGVGPGDEVIIPALTFVAVPATVVYLRASPVIVDVNQEYWCLDPIAVERAISKRTKAIVAVHLYGHPADMDPILDLARRHCIKVIEDCAEAHGANYKGKRVGSIGDVGCFSFYGNKIITTGEGGMAVTNDAELAARMRFFKDHAMDPKRRYFHPEVGFNCRMTNLHAALGCAQLERIDELLEKRAKVLEWYNEALSDIHGISLNPKMPWADTVNWMVCVLLKDNIDYRRNEIIKKLSENGVDTRPFFIPANEMPPYNAFQTVGLNNDKLTISRNLSRAGFNLPSSPSLEKKDVILIIKKLILSLK